MSSKQTVALAFILTTLSAMAILLLIGTTPLVNAEAQPAGVDAVPGGSTVQGIRNANETWGRVSSL
jgi:hypothetical protein